MATVYEEQSQELSRAPTVASPGWRWWAIPIPAVTLIAAFLVVGAIGAQQAARDQRVLGFLEPLVAVVQTGGWESAVWLVGNRTMVGWSIAAGAGPFAPSRGLITRRRALPANLPAAVWRL